MIQRDTLKVDLDERVLIVTIDWAEQLNRLNPQLVDDLTSLSEILHRREDMHAVLPSTDHRIGAGRRLWRWFRAPAVV